MDRPLKYLAGLLMIVFVVVLMWSFVYKRQNKSSENQTLGSSTTSFDKQKSPIGSNVLFSDLPKHNKISDCWVSYKGHIYDITNYFGGFHPGGDAIMKKYCGDNVAKGFDTKERIPAITHSTFAKQLLQKYLIN